MPLLRPSRWQRVLTHRLQPDRPVHTLVHDVTGTCRPAPAALLQLLDLMRQRGPVDEGRLRARLPAEAGPVLDDLLDHRFLVPADTPDEWDLLRHLRPTRRRSVVWRDLPGGGLQLWHDAGRRRPRPVRTLTLQGREADLLRTADGTRTFEEWLGGGPPPEVLFDPARQLVRLGDDDLWTFHEALETRGTRPSLEEFHRDLQDPEANFDHRETTVSHAFRFPTRALQGRAYGEALADRLPLPDGARVLEIGGGLGYVARAFTARAPHVRYEILDLSPALSERQRRFVPSRVGDALTFEGPVDLVIANEVLADLPVAEGRNTGALALLERLRRHARQAVLIEYGEPDRPPAPAAHLDHDEHTIHWNALVEHARALGFQSVQLHPLLDFLGFDRQAPVYSGYLEVLQEALGRPLPTAVLEEIDTDLQGLHFEPLERGRHYGPPVGEFYALVLSC